MPGIFFIYRDFASLSVKRLSLKLSALPLLILIGGGCSTYQNVTGYFNTYYNARKLFNEAVNDVEVSALAQRDSLYFVPYNCGPGPEAKFDKVIEKCSKLIQSYDKSGWVDDAILIIGESYVYKGENESATRKFRELIDNFPASNLVRQAKLWNAKAGYFMKKEDEVLKLTKDLFDEARAEGDNDVLFELLMLEAQIAYERGEYDVAATKYSLASQSSVGDDLRARALYQLGTMYERLGDSKNAAEAYGGVKAFNPPFAIEYQSRLKYGKMLSASQQFDRALAVLDELFEEQLKVEELALVDLEIANTHWARGDSADAFALYTLIDTTYRRTDASAKGYYQRGVIYEKQFVDFEKAREYYTKAKDEFAQSEVTPIAQKKAATLTNYFKLRADIENFDSLLIIARHLDSLKIQSDSMTSMQDTASSEIQERVDSVGHQIDTLKKTGAPVLEVRSDSSDASPEFPDSLSEDSPSSDEAAGSPKGEIGLPPAPDTASDDEAATGRRRERGDTLAKVSASDTLFTKGLKSTKDSLTAKSTREDTSKSARKGSMEPKAVTLPVDSIRSLLGRAKFELGAILFLELQLPDSALRWYHEVVKEYPSSSVVPRTLYAMAEIYRSKNDSGRVDSLYRALIAQHAKSEYAVQAMKLLGMKSDNDLQDSALVHYEAAERLLLERKNGESIKALKEVMRAYPSSPFKSKAMYTIGWIYENVLIDNDSAASWYELLAKEYPSSVYAAAVQAKLAVKADPKALERYVKIKEIHALQPEKAQRKLKDGKKGQGKESQEDELRPGRRNRDRDVEEDDGDEEVEPEEPVEEDDN